MIHVTKVSISHFIEETLGKSAGKLKTNIMKPEVIDRIPLSNDMLHIISGVECGRVIAIKNTLADISLCGWMKPPMSCRE